MRNLFMLGMSTVVLGCMSVHACSTPLYRYALERWPSEPYVVLVFHNGALSPAEKLIFDKIEKGNSERELPTNVWVQSVDVTDKNSDENFIKLWKESGSKSKEGSHMIVRYPERHGVQQNAWEAPLTHENVAALRDSPTRREVAKRLLKGQTAVWLVVESEPTKLSDAVTKEIEEACAKITGEFRAVSIEGAPKISFSVMKVNEKDPAERFFVASILNQKSKDEAADSGVFFAPVYGQGRLLRCPSVAEEQKKEESVAEVCSFLCAPCSCLVQDARPGIELLMSVDWSKFDGIAQVVDKELPPLTGFFGVESNPSAPDTAIPSPTRAAPSSPTGITASTGTLTAVPTIAPTAERENRSSHLIESVIESGLGILIGVVVLLLFTGTVILLKFRSKE